ncbi:hypothetical protein BKA70DRAFT_1244784 [Coprinopsis sp. MPI-PUGE-AT-0042]|nr:hypothetical protein BKA70DRAFT_1244784 [Coprinopsis sp. MPI-PUGE-AT-0042]
MVLENSNTTTFRWGFPWVTEVPLVITLTGHFQKAPNDYMRDWAANKQVDYLHEIMEKEALPAQNICSQCNVELLHGVTWRCKECFGQPLYCTTCVRQLKEIWPPTTPFETIPLFTTLLHDDDPFFGAKPDGRVFGNSRSLVVVHTNGIHHLMVQFCQCDNSLEEDIQLLKMGLYHSSHLDVHTAFTFELLDYYLLDILECYTSSLHFYSKLQRVTNEIFPKNAPDRYREGLRCGRQWRRLKELKRSGRSHSDVSSTTPPGSEALFCAGCPQAGKNLNTGWQNNPETWKYTVSLVADGNFTLVHRASQTSKDDVWLKKPTCNEHCAIEDKYKVHNKGCDVTGVGAFTCTRHGAFAPNSVVDFQKGKQCGISVLPTGFTFTAGIGQFHVHGHQEKCYARYSPLFIDGLGKTSSEILEPLWSVLNEAARPTQVMTLAHRAEVLDALIADNNWKKMTGLIQGIPQAYEKSFKEYTQAQEAFDLLNTTTSDAQRKEWQIQLTEALAQRNNVVSAMDTLNLSIEKCTYIYLIPPEH